MYKIQKLDSRYTGWPHFEFGIDCKFNQKIKLQQLYTNTLITRIKVPTIDQYSENYTKLVSWAWETWGSSIDYKIRENLVDELQNKDWCFISDKYRVLIKSTAQLEWFKLKWEDHGKIVQKI